MRLTKEQINIIKDVINSFIKADIYIFGSRLKDNVKGGDVDIFISPYENLSVKNEFELKLKIKDILEEELFLPVDIVFDKNIRLIDKEAKKGVKI